MLTQTALTEYSPTLKVVVVLGGVFALFIAISVGRVVLRLLFGLAGLALLGGAAWWFLIPH